MPSFNKLKIRTKLLLIFIVPLLGLLFFSVSSTLEKASVSNEMGRLESLVSHYQRKLRRAGACAATNENGH